MEEGQPPDALRRFQSVFNGLLGREAMPEFLYHYTDTYGLDGILGKRSLWLSHFAFLNDAREFIYARDYLVGRLEYVAKMSTDEKAVRLATILHERNARRSINFFIFSLSKWDNQLSQWRAYTPRAGGYSIGFRGELLQSIARQYGATIVPVHYGFEVLNEIFDALFAACLETWTPEGRHDNIDGVDNLFAGIMYEVGVFCKNAAFREEAEWRLILPSGARYDELTKVRPRGPYMLPYAELSFADVLERARTEVPPRDDLAIKIGPGMDQERAQKGIWHLLRAYELRASYGPNSIPYRTD